MPKKQIPPRVLALAATLNDEPLDWKIHTDGTIVIVFNQSGKRTFPPETLASVTTSSDSTPEKKEKKQRGISNPN